MRQPATGLPDRGDAVERCRGAGRAARNPLAPASAGAGRGAAGPYEIVRGRVYGEVDPRDPHNRIIQDLDLAPRNARGRVEYVATFALARPIDPAKASGVLIYQVVNRGNGDVGGEPRRRHHAGQRLAGRRRPDRGQSDDHGAGRPERGRIARHRPRPRPLLRRSPRHDDDADPFELDGQRTAGLSAG